MKDNAPDVLAQLEPPATDDDVRAAEAALGFAVPPALAALWRENDGSGSECGFFGFLEFVSTSFAKAARDDVMLWVETDRKYSLESPQLYRDKYPELADDAWIAIGHQGYADQLALHAKTGRVFRAGKNIPALALLAPSLEAYLDDYANDLERGAYQVEEGFGGFYLERD
jgi:cell wall assembly regulator SMI1